ncbi:hypothetical protein [uncultured Roseobacter sp.]|uniref:hypothetical protein n=1 Tax=uncultured Roseobacter sp. TaxID=114847 RepID=UPI00260A4DBA|nr:hypothetical protein [uncultured Roseobacter sp.]
MEQDARELTESIRQAVVDVLGMDRVCSVNARLMKNEDGQSIVRVNVVYLTSRGLKISEMDEIYEALWPDDDNESAALPIIDFQEDTDLEPIAAE